MDQKVRDIVPWVKTGVIAEAGFGTGQLLGRLARQFPASQLYGIEASRYFFRAGQKRFRRFKKVSLIRNDVVKPNLPSGSVDTKIFSSVLHEVYSYNNYNKTAVERALRAAFRELKRGGRIIIRDGVKPESKVVYLEFLEKRNVIGLSDDVSRVSAEALFLRFARDWKKGRGVAYTYCPMSSGRHLYRTDAASAYEFISKKDYRKNWHIEIDEAFGIFSLQEYLSLVRKVGFKILHARAYRSSWIYRNRWKGKVALYKKNKHGVLRHLPFPATNIVIVAEK